MEDEKGKNAQEKIADIYRNWVKENKIVKTNIWSSELSKLVANAMLAQRVSSINSISALCEKTDADINEVSKSVGMDSRLGSKFLKASVGFGGSCFKKDILNLVYLSEYYNLPEVAEYWEQVVKMNQYQEKRFVARMIEKMFNTVAGKKIALFGFAFKADTGDTRESPAIYISRMLLDERADLAVHDPKALKNAKIDLSDDKGNLSYHEDPYEAAKDAHAIAILTDWDDFKKYDYRKIFDLMDKPAFIFDGRNILDHEKLFKIGFSVYPLGQKAMTNI